MKKVAFYSKPLDDSNGTVKNGQSNAMQSASQTIESPASAKKTPPPNRLGPLAVLAIGVGAAASFLKSKIEKAAAVAAQVGAAVLKSKKAVSATAAAILSVVQPKSQKIAEKRFAKARLASVLPFALLAVFFAASPQGMATGPYIYWTPSYDEERWTRAAGVMPIPFGSYLVPVNDPYVKRYSFSSEKMPPSASVAGHVAETYYQGGVLARIKTSHQTTYYSLGRVSSYELYRDASNRLQYRWLNNHLDLVHHKKVGKQTTYSVSNRVETKTVETWKNRLYSLDTTWQSDGTVSSYFRTVFSASDSSRAYDDPAGYGMCESTRIAFTSPTVEIPICLPSHMSRPSNGYIEYGFWYYYESSSSNEDDEEEEN